MTVQWGQRGKIFLGPNKKIYCITYIIMGRQENKSPPEGKIVKQRLKQELKVVTADSERFWNFILIDTQRTGDGRQI